MNEYFINIRRLLPGLKTDYVTMEIMRKMLKSKNLRDLLFNIASNYDLCIK